MPVLAYSITQPVQIKGIPPGVDFAEIQSFDCAGLRCYFSSHAEFATSPDALQAAALAYHAVVQHLFASTTVIPFRFPTLVASAAELRHNVQDRASDYGAALVRLAGAAQMEINIRTHTESAPAPSGTEYLRVRQQAMQKAKEVATQARQAVGDLARNWRERDLQDRLQCFALVARGTETDFLARLSALQVPSRVECRIVGPWPPSEFIDM